MGAVTDDRVPWQIVTPACGATVFTGAGGAPDQCTGRVTHAGLVLTGRRPIEAWRAFACDRHCGQLRAARPLLDRDREVLADWRQRWRDALDGRGWRRPEPLAVGAAARELVTRAEACR